MFYRNLNTKNNLILFVSLIVFFYLFRLIPHPPNFTPVIALTMYGSIFFGIRSLPYIILAFAFTDLFIGFHSLLFFTWGSLAFIGIFSKLCKHFMTRIVGCFLSALFFYIFTNFGVWISSEFYENNLNGLISCYILAIPFFANTLFSTLLFGLLIEFFFSFQKKSLKFNIK